MTRFVRAILAHPSGRIGGSIIALYLVIAVLGGLGLTPHDPLMQYRIDRLQGPGATYWMGTDLFGRDVTTLLTFNGTGANVLALTSLARPGDAVICSEWAHVNVDETGAPERIAGIKLIDVPAPDGKLTPEQVESHAHALGDFHHAQPAIVSITRDCNSIARSSRRRFSEVRSRRRMVSSSVRARSGPSARAPLRCAAE